MMLGPLCVLLALQVGAVTLADVPNDELAKATTSAGRPRIALGTGPSSFDGGSRF